MARVALSAFVVLWTAALVAQLTAGFPAGEKENAKSPEADINKVVAAQSTPSSSNNTALTLYTGNQTVAGTSHNLNVTADAAPGNSTTSNGSSSTTKATAAPSSPTTQGYGDAVLHHGEDEGVEVISKPHKNTFTSWLTWKDDSFLMSILIPIGCGVAAAVLILCSIAFIGCCRRRCRSRSRRKFPRKMDPKTFRKLMPADRAKLLAASSDEEF